MPWMFQSEGVIYIREEQSSVFLHTFQEMIVPNILPTKEQI